MAQLLAVGAELLLLASCLFALALTRRLMPAIAVLLLPGALLMAGAAALGAAEYAGASGLVELHRQASRAAGTIGLPAIVAAGSLALLAPARAPGIALLLLFTLLLGAVFGIPQTGPVLLVAGLLALGLPAWRRRGRELLLWLAILAAFALAMIARAQIDGPHSAGMTGFHIALATLVACATMLAQRLSDASQASASTAS